MAVLVREGCPQVKKFEQVSNDDFQVSLGGGIMSVHGWVGWGGGGG